LGSPRKQVVENAVRDLEYHDEMLSLLKLPPQQDRDAVMILHMGGMFGSKSETLDRFRENYAKLSNSIKNRLVLENDDMSWSVHDLLPICQELNIPMVLDFHHHNIIFDEEKIREGTKDIVELFPTIRETWTRKNITQKMHYSEPTPAAITRMQRRKHSPRVATLPPCRDDMDLMIEAKDKEQAVFELMRTFKLPGFEKINDIVPHARKDDNKPAPQQKKKQTPKKKRVKAEEDSQDELLEEIAEGFEAEEKKAVPDEEVGMGGPEGRVYWPPGMEDWLRPKKREVKKKDTEAAGSKAKTPKRKEGEKALVDSVDGNSVPTKNEGMDTATSLPKAKVPKKKKEAAVPTPSTSDAEDSPGELDFEAEKPVSAVPKRKTAPGRKSQRARNVNYVEPEHSEME
jgi:UV DNA damage endonuclease